MIAGFLNQNLGTEMVKFVAKCAVTALEAHRLGRASDPRAAAYPVDALECGGYPKASPIPLFLPCEEPPAVPRLALAETLRGLVRSCAGVNLFGGDQLRLVVAGGACVDAALGRPIKDLDLFVIDERPVEQLEAALEKTLRPLRQAAKFCTIRKGVLSFKLENGYPHVPVQVILRPYASMSELLNSFDLPASGVGFDGDRVWVTPASHWCLANRVCPLNSEYRSPSFERRAEKYFKIKGFGLAVPADPAAAAGGVRCGPAGGPTLALAPVRWLGGNRFVARAGVADGIPWSYFTPDEPEDDAVSARCRMARMNYCLYKEIMLALRAGAPLPPVCLMRWHSDSLFPKALQSYQLLDVAEFQSRQNRDINVGRVLRALLPEDLSEYFAGCRLESPFNPVMERYKKEFEARLGESAPLQSYWVVPAGRAEATSSFEPQPMPAGEWARALPAGWAAAATGEAPSLSQASLRALRGAPDDDGDLAAYFIRRICTAQ